jgi:ribose transport system permease protein
MIKEKSSFDFEKVMPFMGLIIITVFFSIVTGGKLLRVSNLSGILNQAIPIIIGGLGMIFVASQGSVDISQGSVLALSGTVAALATSKYGIGILFPVAMLTGGVVGLFNGVILSKFKVSSLTVTLAVLISIRALVAFLTRGEVIYAPLEVLSIGNLSIKLPIFILIVLIIGYLFEYTKIGYYCKVLGENEVVGKYTGISVDKVKILAFMLSGIMAGFLGVFTVSRIGGVDPGMGNFF